MYTRVVVEGEPIINWLAGADAKRDDPECQLSNGKEQTLEQFAPAMTTWNLQPASMTAPGLPAE